MPIQSPHPPSITAPQTPSIPPSDFGTHPIPHPIPAAPTSPNLRPLRHDVILDLCKTQALLDRRQPHVSPISKRLPHIQPSLPATLRTNAKSAHVPVRSQAQKRRTRPVPIPRHGETTTVNECKACGQCPGRCRPGCSLLHLASGPSATNVAVTSPRDSAAAQPSFHPVRPAGHVPDDGIRASSDGVQVGVKGGNVVDKRPHGDPVNLSTSFAMPLRLKIRDARGHSALDESESEYGAQASQKRAHSNGNHIRHTKNSKSSHCEFSSEEIMDRTDPLDIPLSTAPIRPIPCRLRIHDPKTGKPPRFLKVKKSAKKGARDRRVANRKLSTRPLRSTRARKTISYAMDVDDADIVQAAERYPLRKSRVLNPQQGNTVSADEASTANSIVRIPERNTSLDCSTPFKADFDRSKRPGMGHSRTVASPRNADQRRVLTDAADQSKSCDNSCHTGPSLAKKMSRGSRTQRAHSLSKAVGVAAAAAPLLSQSGHTKCTMCLAEMVTSNVHPFFPIRGMQICKSCVMAVSKQSGRKRTSVEDKTAIEKAEDNCTALLISLVEEMIQVLTPTERKARKVEDAYNYLRSRDTEEMIQGIEALAVPYEMLTVIRALLTSLNVTVDAGRLIWPDKVVSLPCGEDARSLITEAIPRSMSDLKNGSTAGERAWKIVFGDVEPITSPLPACRVFEKILGLVSIKVCHVESCEGNSLRGCATCNIRVDVASVETAMLRARDAHSAQSLKRVFASSCRNQHPVPAGDLRKPVLDRSSGVCCICTSQKDAESFPFKFTTCDTCPRQFCSMCLANILGSSEYMLSLEEAAYICILCRFRNTIHGVRQSSKNGDKARLRGVKAKKGLPGSRDQKHAMPLLILSSAMRRRLFSAAGNCSPYADVRFAKLCEVLNEKACAELRGRTLPHYATEKICLGCKSSHHETGEVVNGRKRRRPADDDEYEGLFRCVEKSCRVHMHGGCLGGRPSKRKRGSGIHCPQHKCSVCNAKDDGKLVRCRTCPVAFCQQHLPRPCDVHIFSDKFIACSACRNCLHVPSRSVHRTARQTSRRGVMGGDFEISLAISDRQAAASVENAVTQRDMSK